MGTILRKAYVGVAWLYLAAVVVQFFLAGLGVFVSPEDFKFHAIFGGIILLIGLIGLILSFLAQLPWKTTGLTALLPVLVLVQSTLVEMGRSGVHLVAAFHTVNALIVFSVAAYIALNARALAELSTRSREQAKGVPAPTREPHRVA